VKLRLIHLAGRLVQMTRDRLEKVTGWLNAAYNREMGYRQ
jgi:hypothetical protein